MKPGREFELHCQALVSSLTGMRVHDNEASFFKSVFAPLAVSIPDALLEFPLGRADYAR